MLNPVPVEPRVLPSARELAECHQAEELKHLRGVATSLNDQEAVQLFDAAIRENRSLEVERALARPAQWRAAAEEKAEYHRRYLQERASLEAIMLPPGALIGPGTYAVGGVSSVAQSAGPSE